MLWSCNENIHLTIKVTNTWHILTALFLHKKSMDVNGISVEINNVIDQHEISVFLFYCDSYS